MNKKKILPLADDAYVLPESRADWVIFCVLSTVLWIVLATESTISKSFCINYLTVTVIYKLYINYGYL